MVRTVGSGGELTTGCETISHEALKKDRVQVGSGKVDSSGMTCRARTDDDLQSTSEISSSTLSRCLLLTTFECILLLLVTNADPLTGGIFSALYWIVDCERVCWESAASGITLERVRRGGDSLRMAVRSKAIYTRTWGKESFGEREINFGRLVTAIRPAGLHVT